MLPKKSLTETRFFALLGQNWEIPNYANDEQTHSIEKDKTFLQNY